MPANPAFGLFTDAVVFRNLGHRRPAPACGNAVAGIGRRPLTASSSPAPVADRREAALPLLPVVEKKAAAGLSYAVALATGAALDAHVPPVRRA
jgi:hypothetical protein